MRFCFVDKRMNLKTVEWCNLFWLIGVNNEPKWPRWCSHYVVGWTIWGSVPWRWKIFFISKMSKPAAGPTQPYIQWVLWFVSQVWKDWDVKFTSFWSTSHLHCSAEVKNGWSYAFCLLCAVMVWTEMSLPVLLDTHICSLNWCVIVKRKFYTDLMKWGGFLCVLWQPVTDISEGHTALECYTICRPHSIIVWKFT
jgi:hypothetical protein